MTGRTARGLILAVAALWLAGGLDVSAHEVRPGFLELRQTGPETYTFLWKKPSGRTGAIMISTSPAASTCRPTRSGRAFSS